VHQDFHFEVPQVALFMLNPGRSRFGRTTLPPLGTIRVNESRNWPHNVPQVPTLRLPYLAFFETMKKINKF
jgi:hypothetical protein